MKKFFKEFKEFISRGNVMDMAIGIIIGGAFTGVVSSLVKDVVNPFLGLFGGMNFDMLKLEFKGVTLNYGSFITALLNFLIMALVVFLIVKSVNKVSSMANKKKEEEEEEPTTQVCPFCKSEIDIEATRCPHCTSVIETEE